MTKAEKMRVCFLCNYFETWCSRTYCSRNEDGTKVERMTGFDAPVRQRDGYEKACKHFDLVELAWHDNTEKPSQDKLLEKAFEPTPFTKMVWEALESMSPEEKERFAEAWKGPKK